MEAKLLKVFCIGCPEKVPNLSEDDWTAWRNFVTDVATEEFKYPLITTEWRPGSPEEIGSLYGVAFHVVDDEGNIHKSYGGGYHAGKLKEESEKAPVEDWSLELNQGMLPIARRVQKLHEDIAEGKKQIIAILDGIY